MWCGNMPHYMTSADVVSWLEGRGLPRPQGVSVKRSQGLSADEERFFLSFLSLPTAALERGPPTHVANINCALWGGAQQHVVNIEHLCWQEARREHVAKTLSAI